VADSPKYLPDRRKHFLREVFMFIFHRPKSLLALIIVVACAGFAYSQRIKAVPDPDSAGILRVKKAGSDLPSGDLAEKVEKDSSGRSTLKMSADKRYEASVFVCPRHPAR
jgi:hypothetical protein